jgi:hypothetical protein
MTITGFSAALTGQDNGIYFINMPDTSFRTLTWKDGFYSRSEEKRYGLPVIYLNVSTSKADKYFILNDSGTKKVSSESEFKELVRARPALSAEKRLHHIIRMLCKDLKRFQRKFNSDNEPFHIEI